MIYGSPRQLKNPLILWGSLTLQTACSTFMRDPQPDSGAAAVRRRKTPWPRLCFFHVCAKAKPTSSGNMAYGICYTTMLLQWISIPYKVTWDLTEILTCIQNRHRNFSFLHAPLHPPPPASSQKNLSFVLVWLTVSVRDLICNFLPLFPGIEHFSYPLNI